MKINNPNQRVRFGAGKIGGGLGLILFFLAGLSLPLHAGVALRLYYKDIPGDSVAELTNHASFPNLPANVELITDGLEKVTASGDQYGTWTRGYLMAPQSGHYTFLLASDDQSEWWLSTDHLAENRRKIAENLHAVKPRDYFAAANQRSEPVPLVKGRQYYFELLHKQGTGGDHVSVAWRLPDGVVEQPIPAVCLLPLVVDDSYRAAFGRAPHILTRYSGGPVATLTNISTDEGRDVTFAITVEASPPVFFQWLRNREPIVGATLPFCRLTNVSLENDVDLYSVIVSNEFGSASAEAVLSVFPRLPPSVVSALNLGVSNQCAVFFSEGVEAGTAGRRENYSIGGTTVLNATVLNPRTVVLETKPGLPAAQRSLQIRNIKGMVESTPPTLATTAAIEPELKLWLRFEDMDSTDALDSSGNGVVAVLKDKSMRTEEGKNGAGLHFNGSDDYASFAAGMSDFTDGMTMVVWARPTAVKRFARFLEFGNGVLSDNIIFGRMGDSSDLFFEVHNGKSSGGKVIAANAIELNEWQHFAASMTPDGRVSLYKNGVVVAEGTTGVPGIITRSNNYLGRSNWPADVDEFYEGEMDEVRVYQRALSAEEIKVLAGSVRGVASVAAR